MSAVYLPPFPAANELIPNGASNEQNPPFYQDIPNETSLSSSLSQVNEFLDRELRTRLLDDLHPHLWLIAKKAGNHIDALHKQIIKGRSIIAAEDTGLHLVWYYDKIYLKPLPHCLLNFHFWARYLVPAPPTNSGTPAARQADSSEKPHPQQQQYAVAQLSDNCRRALGLLRSYAFLVRHESDFAIARAAHLVPERTTYAAFQRFVAPLRALADGQVAGRYQYGQLRLTRLDFAVRVCRPRSAGARVPWFYHRQHWQTGGYISAMAPVLVFVFASLSLILSSMQVVIAALGQDAWAAFVSVSWGFSVAVIVLLVVITVGVLLAVVVLFLHQGLFSVRMKLSERKESRAAI